MPANPDYKDLSRIFYEEKVDCLIVGPPLMGVAGVDFDTAWANRAESSYNGVPIRVPGKYGLIRAKQTAGRPQDLLDLQNLQQTDGAEDR